MTHPMTPPKKTVRTVMKGERGSALLIVLWLLVLISAIAVSMSGTTRVESRLAFNLVEEARARYLAQAGINHAILTLLKPRAPRQRVMDGAAVTPIDLFGMRLGIRIRDECGKVDLNTAWGGLIGGLLAGHRGQGGQSGQGGQGGQSGQGGQGEPQAFDLTQAILDWRDPDKIRRLRGAEDDDYAAAGMAYGARDGLFETIEELQQVRGMTEGLYQRLSPDVTVDCLAAGIDPLAASPAVLAALPGLTPPALEAFLRARREAAVGDKEVVIPTALLGSKFVEASLGDVFSIEATVDSPSGNRVAWQAVVWLTGDPTRSFVVRSWRRVPAPAADR